MPSWAVWAAQPLARWSRGDAAGAAVGGLIGGVGGYLIGKSTDRAGYCRYRDQNGRIYEDRC